MNNLAKTALISVSALFTSACSSMGYSNAELNYNASPLLGPLPALARKAEDGLNEPSVGAMTRGGLLGNASAEVRAARDNPVDLTPNLDASGRIPLGDGRNEFQRTCERNGGEIEVVNGTETCRYVPR